MPKLGWGKVIDGKQQKENTVDLARHAITIKLEICLYIDVFKWLVIESSMKKENLEIEKSTRNTLDREIIKWLEK